MMYKKIIIFSLLSVLSFADTIQKDANSTKKSWVFAVLACADEGKRLPDKSEIKKVDTENFALYWRYDTPNFFSYKKSFFCLSDSDKKNTQDKIDYEFSQIEQECQNQHLIETDNKTESMGDNNKTFLQKTADVVGGVGTMVGKTTQVAAGVGLSIIPGGSGLGGSLIENAFGINKTNSDTDKLTEKTCVAVHSYLKQNIAKSR